MVTIKKYELDQVETQNIYVNPFADILCVKEYNNKLYMFFMVNTSLEQVQREIKIFETDKEIDIKNKENMFPENTHYYVDSVLMDNGSAFHVFIQNGNYYKIL